MKACRRFIAVLVGTVSASLAQDAVVPAHKSVHVLLAGASSSEKSYLAFPAVIDLGSEVLVSFKQGNSHASDSGAVLGLARLDGASGAVRARVTLAEIPGKIMQMGEWVRFPNGDIANCIDAQQVEVPTRIGLQLVRSNDEGRTFGPVQRFGVVDGVEYGYAFDAITRGSTTWMLVMTFANLSGGKLIHPTRSQPGSVDVIRSDDNGITWHFVRSITAELGNAPINESAFLAHDGGFIVTARGYDNRQWLLRTDADFKMTSKADLTANRNGIDSYIGRPRLFMRDGGCYLLGRNRVGHAPMQLALFRFDPASLKITKHVVLDNAELQPVADGYYAQPFWRERNGRSLFHVVTYKRGSGKTSDIIQLEFDWEEMR